MEIITYVREGAITHRDSLGDAGIDSGDVQVMSAGSGVRHAEYNRKAGTTRICQLWIEPTTREAAPSRGARPCLKGERSGRLVTLASGFSDVADALPIRAQARVVGTTRKAGETADHPIGADRHGYLVPATRAIEVNGVRLDARDCAAIADIDVLRVTAVGNAGIVLVDAA